MKRRPPLPLWTEALIPALPLFASLVSWKTGLLTASLGALVFLPLAFAAKILAPVLKKTGVSILYFLAAAVSVYALHVFWDVSATLVLSLCLLGPAAENKTKFNPSAQALILKAAVFFVLAIYLAVAQEILGGVFHLSFFQRVPGTLLLLLIPAFFWPASRKLKGKTGRSALPIEVAA